MTPADQKAEWLHMYSLIQTDATRFVFFSELKRNKSGLAQQVLRECIERWLKS